MSPLALGLNSQHFPFFKTLNRTSVRRDMSWKKSIDIMIKSTTTLLSVDNLSQHHLSIIPLTVIIIIIIIVIIIVIIMIIIIILRRSEKFQKILKSGSEKYCRSSGQIQLTMFEKYCDRREVIHIFGQDSQGVHKRNCTSSASSSSPSPQLPPFLIQH